MARVLLGLGTNLGDRRTNLSAGLEALSAIVRILRISSVYRSEPVGYRDQPDFWNIVVSGETELEPAELLAAARAIEAELGRRPAFRNAPRTLDIDLLLFEDRVIATAEVEVPHPRMLERAFVLRPLVEVEPDAAHPVTGRRIAEHLAEAETAGTLERTERLFPGEELLGEE